MTVKYPLLLLAFILLPGAVDGQEFSPVDARKYEDMSFLATNPFRKLVTAAGSGQVTQAPPGNYVLVGVVARGDQDVAYLRDKKDGSVFKVEKDEEIKGVTLIDVANGRINQETYVTVRSAGREFEVFFDMESARPGTSASSAKSKTTSEKSKGKTKGSELKMNPDGTEKMRLR